MRAQLKTFGGTLTAIGAVLMFAAPADAQTALRSTTAGTTVKTSSTSQYQGIDPYYRRIRGFWGEVNPFYRRIRGFWGDVDPFFGNVNAFWGNIDPMYRRIRGWSVVPEFNGMGAFWEQQGGLWTQIDTRWATATTDPTFHVAVKTMLEQLRTNGANYFGPTITNVTGQSFNTAFADAMFAKHGINLNDPASLARLDETARSRFFMDWYDGLMEFSGTDHVDHWMKTANWNPRLTQVQGGGAGTVIGLVDMFVAGDADIRSKVVWQGGSTWTNGHGAAVGSLLVSSHDGRGVMGISPGSRLAAYNPFDATGSADWAGVRQGITMVRGSSRAATDKATVINLSLGVPGWTLHPDWHTQVFANSTIKGWKDHVAYVIAAGNDGITQTQNVEWKDALQTKFILVGSLNPSGTISDFSNRPGNVCLLDGGVCKNSLKLDESGLLMHRFITAPGELILVSDDKGGVTRLSGTSFAAPMVSGAIALLQDRWPWLKQKPQDAVHIILKSAKDLGAPGVDPVYGVGMLDIAASQSPLDFNSLKYYLYSGTNKLNEVTVSTLQSGGLSSSWSTNNLYFSAFESLPNGQRDFLIPLSSRLWGSTSNGEYFQDYLYSRFSTVYGGVRSITDKPRTLVQMPTTSGWRMTLSAGESGEQARAAQNGFIANSAVRFDAPAGRFGFTLGHGGGALAIGGQPGFALTSDHDPERGGVNPVLGFASGGAYASADVALTDELGLSLGLTQRQRAREADLALAGPMQAGLVGRLERFQATAGNLQLSYRPHKALNLSVSWSTLGEKNSLLGVRSLERGDLGVGTNTDAATLGAELDMGDGITLLASATGSRTKGGRENALSPGEDGLVGSAYQFGVAKTGLFARDDKLRLSFAQPLTIERGKVDFTSVRVLDRETGEVGVATDSFDVATTERRYVGEAIYALPMAGGELSAFGRGEIEDTGDSVNYVAGVRARVPF